MKHKPVLYLAGDSTAQSYDSGDRPQAGWGGDASLLFGSGYCG